MKLHRNPISGSRDGRTERQTSMTKIIVTFRYFASMPKNKFVICGSIPISIFFCVSRPKYLVEYLDTAQILLVINLCASFPFCPPHQINMQKAAQKGSHRTTLPISAKQCWLQPIFVIAH